MWERFQSFKRRAGEIGEPYRSYDDMMVWVRARKQQQQQQEKGASPEIPRTPPPHASSVHQQQQSESGGVELGAGVAGVGAGQEQHQQQQQKTEALPETPRTPPLHALSVQQHQQSES